MKLFQNVLEIKSKTGELHFRRFAFFETKYLSLYFHRIYLGDKDVFLHSHPWNFISIILKGGYIEENQKGLARKVFPVVSMMNRKGFHKIHSMLKSPTYSLFLAIGKKQPWYYLVNGEKIESTRFREIKNLPEYQYIFKNNKDQPKLDK